jgi:hypothetical protein
VRLAALPAALALAALGLPVQPAPATVLHVRLCSGGSAEVPIDRDRPDNRDCPSACHAVLCSGRKRAPSV